MFFKNKRGDLIRVEDIVTLEVVGNKIEARTEYLEAKPTVFFFENCAKAIDELNKMALYFGSDSVIIENMLIRKSAITQIQFMPDNGVIFYTKSRIRGLNIPPNTDMEKFKKMFDDLFRDHISFNETE